MSEYFPWALSQQHFLFWSGLHLNINEQTPGKWILSPHFIELLRSRVRIVLLISTTFRLYESDTNFKAYNKSKLIQFNVKLIKFAKYLAYMRGDCPFIWCAFIQRTMSPRYRFLQNFEISIESSTYYKLRKRRIKLT